MEKIDRLGWAAGLSLMAYGIRLGIRTNKPEYLEQLIERLPPGWKPSKVTSVDRLYSLRVGGVSARPGVRRFNILYSDFGRLARSLDLDEVLNSFESNVQLHVAEMSPRRVFVHAGVVGWKGKAIIIPGRTFTGKTTLVAELVKAGATFYSDEYAVLDQHGHVHPYPKPLGIREDETARQTKLAVETLGGRTGAKPLPVGLVLVSEYKAGARWRPQRLSAGQGALAMLNNTVSARQQPEAAMAVLQQVVERAPVVKSARGEAAEVVTSIIQHVGN